MVDIASVEPVKEAVSEPGAWMSPNGDFGEGVPENIQSVLDAKKWTNVGQVMNGYTELEKFKGIGEHLVIPESDDIKAWDDVYTKLGRPKEFGDYTFDNQTGVDIDDTLLSGFKQFAHKEGYTQKQLSGAVQFQLEAIKASEELYNTQMSDRREENLTAMKSKWGQVDFEPTLKRVDATAEKLQVLGFLKDRGIDREPEIVNMLLTISNSDREDTIANAGDGGVGAKTNQQQLDDIMESDAYKDKFHRDHKRVMEEYMKLNMGIANSGQGRAPRS